MERPFSVENLKTIYTERLRNISSRKDLETALREGKVNLELDLNEFVSPERREEILRGNPDEIEILGSPRRVTYGYDEWNKKFSASVKGPASDVLKLSEMPVLPSGRTLALEVVAKEGEIYTQFSGINLEELRQKSRQFLIKKQWDEWRYSGKAPQEQRLENFNLLGELPVLPEPIQFGSDPEIGEPLLAFPAFTVESPYYGEEYTIKFFSSPEEANKAQAKVMAIIEQEKIKQQKKEEKERLLVPARVLLQKVKSDFNNIGYDYEDYGLSYSDKGDIRDKLWQAEREIETDTKKALEILQELDQRVTQALDYKEQSRLAKEKADAAVSEHYIICPLCGKSLENGECTNSEHKAERIDFGFDEDGNEIGSATLSQIITDQKKIIAQLKANAGGGRRHYGRYRGDIYLVRGNNIEKNAWQGEPFTRLEFEDFKKILTLKEVEEKTKQIEVMRQERERAEVLAHYQEELEYAKQQVKEGYWKVGKFSKGIHPKSDEEQWELTFKSQGLIIKYVVDHWSHQPSAENLDYFYSEDKTLVDIRGFRLILVRLKNPFPEDKPEEPEPQPESEQSEPATSKPLAESLEELKKKWGAK